MLSHPSVFRVERETQNCHLTCTHTSRFLESRNLLINVAKELTGILRAWRAVGLFQKAPTCRVNVTNFSGFLTIAKKNGGHCMTDANYSSAIYAIRIASLCHVLGC